MEPENTSRDRPPMRRRPYRAPELVEYGSVAARTLGQTTGSFPDSMAGLQMNPGSGPPPMCY